MWNPFKRQPIPAAQVLSLVGFNRRDTQLIEDTLAAASTRQPWQIGEPVHARVVLVDLDAAGGRNQWWRLRHERSDRLVAAVSKDPQLRGIQPVLSRPILGVTLARLLDDAEHMIAEPARRHSAGHSVAAAVVNCPFERFILACEDGDSYLFDRLADRLYLRGTPDRLRSLLFEPLATTGIREIRQRPESLAGASESRSCRLSLMLATCALGHPEPERLEIFACGRPIGLRPGAATSHLPLTQRQQAVVRLLERQSGQVPLDLVIRTGQTARQVAAVLAALWLTGALLSDTPAEH